MFDLRDGLLVQAVAEDPDLLVRGQVPVPGAATQFYDLMRIHDYGIEGGRLVSSRSVNAFAAGGMSLLRPESIVMDSWAWVLGADGVLRTGEPRCLRQGPEFVEACEPGAIDDPPVVAPVADETFGRGEQADFDEGYAFTAGVEAVADPSLAVTGSDGRTLDVGLEVTDPRISTVQPTSLFYDGASVVVTSGSDPAYVEVLVQDGDTMRALQPVGEIALANGGQSAPGSRRTASWSRSSGRRAAAGRPGSGSGSPAPRWRPSRWARSASTTWATRRPPPPARSECLAEGDEVDTREW